MTDEGVATVVRELGLFAGAGGFVLAAILLGWRPVGYVEIDEWCCGTLGRRVDDGTYPAAPVLNCDVRDFVRYDFAQDYQGMVDVLTAGFPCQPFSSAGRLLGENDPRNMWPATVECIRIVRPEWVFLENVAAIRNPKRKKGTVLAPSYLGRVFIDLAESGFDIAWDCIPASALGAPHRRDRIWIVAHANGGRQQRIAQRQVDLSHADQCGAGVADANCSVGDAGDEPTGRETRTDACRCLTRAGLDVSNADRDGRCRTLRDTRQGTQGSKQRADADGQAARDGRPGPACATALCHPAGVGCGSGGVGEPETLAGYAAALRAGWWSTEPGICRVAYAVADQTHRLRALGEGIVPAVAAVAWRLLSSRLTTDD